MASFYHIPLDTSRLHAHTLFATPDEGKDPVGQNGNDLSIDETTPSEDDCFAESVLWEGKYTTLMVYLLIPSGRPLPGELQQCSYGRNTTQ